MQRPKLTSLRLISQILPARRSDDRRRFRTMSQRTELFTVRDLILVVPVLTIKFNKLRMVRYFTEFRHDGKGVALGALLAGLPIAVLARRSEITSGLEVAAELSR